MEIFLKGDMWYVTFECPADGIVTEEVPVSAAVTERQAKAFVLNLHAEHIAAGHVADERAFALTQIIRAEEEVTRVKDLIRSLKGEASTDRGNPVLKEAIAEHEAGLIEAKKHLEYVTETNAE